MHQPAERRLTAAQLAFVDAYVRDPKANATAAAVAAGYSPKTAASMAWELLRTPKYAHVQAEIQRRQAELAAQLDVSDEDVWRGIAAVAKGDITRVIGISRREEGPGYQVSITPFEELTAEERALIKRVNVFDGPYGQTINIEFHDRQEALFRLAKMKGLMRDKVDLDVHLRVSENCESVRRKLASLASLSAAGVPDESEPPRD